MPCYTYAKNKTSMSDIKSQVTIRTFRPGDYDQVLQVWEATGLGGAHRGDNLPVILHSISIGGKLLLACMPDGSVIGTSWITYDGRRMHLHHVGVLPQYQRQGIGSLLSEESVRYAREKNTQIKLEVHLTNKGAIALYRRLGFTYLGDYDVYIMRETQEK